MIELPEAIAFSKQINETLMGKVIKSAIRGQNPHKFMFPMEGSKQVGSEFSNEDFSHIISGKTIGKSWHNGNIIIMEIGVDYVLSLGCGGEKILYHTQSKTIPKKHQLLLEFLDNTFFTVTISGWGEIRLLKKVDLDKHPHIGYDRVDPLSKEFTFAKFENFIKRLSPTKKGSAKKFFITEPGLRGIGNGVIQDIFWNAKINPKREMSSLNKNEQKQLYDTTRKELMNMADLGGREIEKDLFNRPGGYKCVMHNKSNGKPCPICKTPIIKQQYLGGSVYFCPSCQPMD
jgi:formamidopyrimidine-DNA glycosylase